MSKKPNILLLVSDQHNHSVAGFAGDSLVQTPALNGIAQRGVVFENAFCQAPICTPSRMSFLTGKLCSDVSAWNNHWVLFPEHRTMAHHFTEAGYETCLAGKMHFGGAEQFHGFTRRPYGDFKHALGHQPDPIDMFPNSGGVVHACESQIPESLQQENVVTLEGAAFVLEHQARNPGKPWFLCASYCKPHAPLAVPGRYLKRYLGKVPSVRLEDEDQAARHPYPTRNRHNYGMSDISQEQIDKARAAYWGAVDFLDDCIAALLWRLEQAGALENTIIVYISDHGDLIGNHGLWGKAIYYEEAIHVPFLIAGPGVRENLRRKELVALTDLYPTLCALCGLDLPEGIEGMDVSCLLTEGTLNRSPRDHIVSEYYGIGLLTQLFRDGSKGSSMRLYRTERYKYVNTFDEGDLFFDLESDPREFRNALNDDANKATITSMSSALNDGFDWHQTLDRINRDRERSKKFMSGMKPTTPNQYMLPDGRMFDAEGDLYGIRWLQTETCGMGGIIPQRYG